MSTGLLTTLSSDFMWLLECADDYNILIRVGEEPKVQIFKAHSVVLRARSTYFRYALSSGWATMEGNTYIFTKPNITPGSFNIILNYIYSGTVSLEKITGEEILELLVATDELCLNELLEHVQDYFIKNRSEWLYENFNEHCHIIFQHNFQQLQQSCIKMVSNDPQKFRRHGEFMGWPDNLIIGILKRDDLHLEEIDVWNILIRWGMAQIGLPLLSSDLSEWTGDDFAKSALSFKLKDFIQYIRFYHISGADFYNHVRNFEFLIPKDLYQELLNYHQFRIKPNIILSPRGISLDSKLIGTRHAALIASWIDHQENFNPVTCHLVPYQFNLLLRGSRDNFECSTFHKLCDNQGPAIIVLKVKGTGELLGGFNPNGWNSTGAWIESTESFIFSLGDGKDPSYSILSRIRNSTFKCAIDDSPCIGPCFGTSDLVMVESFRHANGKFIYDLPWSCIQNCYERTITQTTSFAIEDYEVFKLIQKTPNPNPS